MFTAYPKPIIAQSLSYTLVIRCTHIELENGEIVVSSQLFLVMVSDWKVKVFQLENLIISRHLRYFTRKLLRAFKHNLFDNEQEVEVIKEEILWFPTRK